MHTISLNGTWTLGWFDGQRGGGARLVKGEPAPNRFLEAQVPGEVHLDLMRCGLLSEPNEGLNCLAARWVEDAVWYYRRTFDAPPLQPGERAWLVFERLELSAVIYLNGEEIGRHNNAFYPCRLDVTGRLHEGQNSLTVQIEAGPHWAADRPGSGYGLQPDSQLRKRNWLRTIQSSFGWDWSTHLLNVGISGEARLEIARAARLEALVVLSDLSEDLTSGKLTVRAFVQGLAEESQAGELLVEVEGQPPHTIAVEIAPGMKPFEAQIDVPNPRLWWPNGHGEQVLYKVRAALRIDGAELGAAERRVGFRHVRVDQSPHPESGLYFIFYINNKPIFVKGGNFVPADMIPARLDRDRYAVLVDRAVEANFNMLRIWGGGMYESDDFYEICDERGMLVWQEFIFACAKYPAFDEAFLENIKQEAAYQVRRLAHHPALVVWCGNNEMEWGNFNWGYEKGVSHPDYSIFHMVLPVILKREDGTRFYHPSSPYSPDHESPNRDDMGDQHPWSVGFAETDFRKYRQMICRFPNEGGILGPTALPTVRACLPADHDRPGSFAFQMHDNGIGFSGQTTYPDDMLVQWLGKHIDTMTIEDYVYWAGVVQGEGLTEYIRNFRRRMFSTSSAIFWMYNDNWPVTRSWTIVDYYLRRTPAFYPVRRAFKPLAVFIAVEDERVKVFGVNEGPEWSGELRCGLFALSGGYPVDLHQTVTLPSNTSTLLAEFELAEWQRVGITTHTAFAILIQNDVEVSRDTLFLPYFKEMEWAEAEVGVRQEKDTAIFESDQFAWRICLDLDGEDILPDNFFDVFPGIPTILPWPESSPPPCILRTGNLLA
jgi:beta-mannosidase